MDTKTYMNFFDRTLSGGAVKGFLVHPHWLGQILNDRLRINKKIDAAKKALFYGKQSDLVPTNFDEVPHSVDEQPDILHAILGLDSEAGELIELLAEGRVTREKVLDEGGDLLWYLALLFKRLDISFEEAMEKNIAKLAARYPDGFSELAAIHRNEERENTVFQ